MKRAGSKARSLIELAAIIMVAALVIFFRLHTPPVFWWDETRVAVNSLEMMTAANPLIVTFNGHADLWNTKPPLVIWLNALSIRAFGVNELALRLPSALAAVATVLVVYLFTLRISQNRATAFFAALILLGTGGYVEVHVARTADFDSLLVLFVTLTTFSLFFALERADASGKWFYAAAAFFAGAIFTKGVAALLILPGYLVYALLCGKMRAVAANRSVWVSALIVLVPISLFLVARESAESGYLDAMWAQDVSRFQAPADEHFAEWHTYLSGLMWPWQAQLFRPPEEYPYGQSAFPWILFVPFAALPFATFPSGSLSSRASVYLLCCLLLFLVMVSTAATKLAWYVAPVYPLIAVLSALGIGQLQTVLGWRWGIAAGSALAIVCVALNMWKIEQDVSQPRLSAEQWLPSFLRSLDLPASAKVRVVGELKWPTPAVKNGETMRTTHFYGPLEFYVRAMRRRGRDAQIVEPGYVPRPGDAIVGCGAAVLDAYRSLRVVKAQGSCFALAA